MDSRASIDERATDVVVVGAGLAGLTAARELAAAGARVIVIDKGRSVGGRLATRRIGRGRADHGAQFFTVRDERFRATVEEWLSAGLVFEWARGWSDGSLAAGHPDGYPRLAVRDGFTTLPKHLAAGLDVRLNVRLIVAQETTSGWYLSTEDGRTFAAKALLLTPPVPQSLSLLRQGGVTPENAGIEALEQIGYAPCLCGLYDVDGEVTLPEPGALQRPNHDISWIADNQRKGISPEARIITVHAGPDFSHRLWDATDGDALSALTNGLRPFLGARAAIREAQLKRWRYALPIRLHPDRCLAIQSPRPLIFAGDAFGEPRVEGAFLSGLAAATAALRLL